MRIRKELLWDYDWTASSQEDPSFRRFYLARVLTRGGDDDIKTLNKDEIRTSLPNLSLPGSIRKFWEWYFSERKIFGNSNETSKGNPSFPGSNPA